MIRLCSPLHASNTLGAPRCCLELEHGASAAAVTRVPSADLPVSRLRVWGHFKGCWLATADLTSEETCARQAMEIGAAAGPTAALLLPCGEPGATPAWLPMCSAPAPQRCKRTPWESKSPSRRCHSSTAASRSTLLPAPSRCLPAELSHHPRTHCILTSI